MSDTLLPPNATEAERAMETTIARVSSVPVPARFMWSPQNCPLDLLPWLAWAFSVDQWDTTWTEQQKRAAIATAYSVHRRKGTIGAVKRAVGALGLDIQIIEWFQDTPVGDPYTFRIVVGSGTAGASQEQLLKMLDVVASSKNLRSHLGNIQVRVTSNAEQYHAGVTLIGSEIQINSDFTLKLDGTWKLDGSQKLNGIKQ